MSKIDILKEGLGWVIGSGVSRIIGDIVDEHVTQETTYQKITVFAGKVGIAMVVREAIQETVDEKIDKIAEKIQEWREKKDEEEIPTEASAN